MGNESVEERQARVIKMLNEKYPGKDSYDLDGRGLHFVCEVEPVSQHPEYDTAVEVIIKSKPHKHLKNDSALHSIVRKHGTSCRRRGHPA